MKVRKLYLSTLLSILLLGVTFSFGIAADHKDAPISGANPAADITDVYAFQNPNDLDKVILVMNVNPLTQAGATANFARDVTYRLLVDNDGDFKEDVVIRINFKDLKENSVEAFEEEDDDGDLNAESMKKYEIDGQSVKVKGPHTRFFAGLRDDPFFFDLAGFKNGLNFTGVDFFTGTNVSAIVIEIPQGALRHGAKNNVLHIWGETRQRGKGSHAPGPNIDRMGNPAINTVFIPTGRKDAFNQGEPKDDPANFSSDFPAAFAALASVLLPDVITLDLSKPSGFLNGRRLQDDVIDIELGILHGLAPSVPATDGVNSNDKSFLTDFPFLAAPW